MTKRKDKPESYTLDVETNIHNKGGKKGKKVNFNLKLKNL